jgi:hypothetical protein
MKPRTLLLIALALFTATSVTAHLSVQEQRAAAHVSSLSLDAQALGHFSTCT